VYQKLFAEANATVVKPPILSLDWGEGFINVQHVYSPLLWPLYDRLVACNVMRSAFDVANSWLINCRTYTVLHVVHPASRTMVAASVPLSDLQRSSLLGGHTTFKGAQAANMNVALRVTRIGPEHAATTGLTQYRIDVVFAVHGVLRRRSLDYRLVKNWYLPNLVRELQQRVVAVNSRSEK
jgi:hypothetical protein